jgi:TPR repeat protein
LFQLIAFCSNNGVFILGAKDENVEFQGPLRLIYLEETIPNARRSYALDIRTAYNACLVAARKGNGDAAGAIGHMYLNKSIKCDDYHELSLRWAQSAIEMGSAYGRWLYGWILLEQKNADEGIAQLREAMNAGYSPAAFDLGVIYQNGWGVPRDWARSKIYYQEAHSMGHFSAPWAIRNVNVSGEFGLWCAIVSRLLRPLSHFRWSIRVSFGSKLSPRTLVYPYSERMRIYRSAAISEKHS